MIKYCEVSNQNGQFYNVITDKSMWLHESGIRISQKSKLQLPPL